ncbi:Uma2 family endonuclease [Sporosarcina saromensis]|uniref:Uma2 family endonuclease n=1 Tax=Sporosarcina saromensis TaxID=359365 RepID=A0ABU4G8G2_9BACL|nr:Uma2 family endonuclease [Sporosarcina saromensis]MDW0113264.1 Uma2 family endonuclease [Sporosarcina saromensis]
MTETDSTHKFMIKEVSHWDGQWELIDGVPFNMTPAPSATHQRIVGELFFALRSYFGTDGCAVFIAPFDVQLDKSDDYTIVQPDVSVFCRRELICEHRAIGCPDLLVEVLSPSTALKDRNQKFKLFERSGVQEFWIVDAHNQTVEVYGLSERRYRERAVFGHSDTLRSFLFPDLKIELKRILFA